MGIFSARPSGMRKWAATARGALEQVPRPADPPQVHSDGPDADRILIAGNGIAVGWGTTSHTDALPGALATALTDLTGRGTDVDILADPALTAASARIRLASAKLWRFDAIVLSLGTEEALAMLSVEDWRANLALLLEEIERSAAPSTRLVVVGARSVTTLPVYDGPFAERADAQLVLFNELTAALCAGRAKTTFVLPAADPTDYAATAEELADSMIDELNGSRRESAGAVRGPSGQAVEERERERQAAVDSVRIVDTPEDDRYDRIVTMAKQLYGTSGAAFAVLDRGRVWHKSKSEGVPLEVPKDASFCSTTVLLRGPHVVPDMRAEGAPDDTSAADSVGVRFYAGYPVESPSGEQIGALCVFDEKPRAREDFDETLLRQLALLIQAEIQVDALSR